MNAAFRDRGDAGARLGGELRPLYGGRGDLLVLALPRGGVPVAAQVARALHAPLDVLVVRKIGVPGREELSMGAVGPNGVLILDEALAATLGLEGEQIWPLVERERFELDRREIVYRGTRPPVSPRGKVVILVDDGLATGNSMLAAIRSVQRADPAWVAVAVPVASRETAARLELEVDQLVSLKTPEELAAVSRWYREFPQVTELEVQAHLASASSERGSWSSN